MKESGALMVTIKDIARVLKVSPATVSLVLNGKDKKRVNPQLARIIKETAHSMGYRSNLVARSLKTNSSKILGFISDTIATTPFAGRIILGAQDAARQSGYLILTVNTNGDKKLEEEEIDTLKRYGVDGFLYACMYNQVVDLPESLSGYPTVIIDGSDRKGSCPAVAPNEVGIGYMSTQELIKAGCRRIAFFNAQEDIRAKKLRAQGYFMAMKEGGLPCEDSEKGVSFYSEYADKELAEGAVDLFDRVQPDGIFCFNDIRASYIYAEAERHHLSVGKDVSIVSVDNQPLIVDALHPGLTSVELPHYEMGYWAVKEIISQSEGKKVNDRQIVFPNGAELRMDSPHQALINCALIRRDSCKHSL